MISQLRLSQSRHTCRTELTLLVQLLFFNFLTSWCYISSSAKLRRYCDTVRAALERDKRLPALEGCSRARSPSPTPHRDTKPCGILPALATRPAPTCRAHGSAACALPARGLRLGLRAPSRPQGSVPAAATGTEARGPPRLLRPRGSAAPWAPPISSPEHTHTPGITRCKSPLLSGWGGKRGGSRAFPAVQECRGLVFSRTHPVQKSPSGTEGTWEVSPSDQVLWCGMISTSTI